MCYQFCWTPNKKPLFEHSHTHNPTPNPLVSPGNHKKFKTPSAFLLDFPMKTNYMYGRMRRSIANELFALTICLWVKAGSGPGLGTPFSYAVQGQANELVLIEWGSNPMELLINDKVNLTDGIKADIICFGRMVKFLVFGFCGPSKGMTHCCDPLSCLCSRNS